RGRSPNLSERSPDLGREQLGFFPGGEVTALVHVVEVDEGGVRLLDPTARGRDDLAGERGEADRDFDRRGSLAGRASLGLSALPVPAGPPGPRARPPGPRDGVPDVV